VPFEDVELIAGDTQSSPKGMDTYGSRSLVVGGVAIHKATGKVLDKAKRIAAHLLEAPRATSSSRRAPSPSRARPRRA
jgi:carbon-monoxide dehydrogenase large subunit